jgi:hypothetical protein
MPSPAWDEKDLVRDPDARRRRYRRLQSWYRETQLHLSDCGVIRAGTEQERRVGNLLSDAAVAADPSLNFLAPSTFAHEILRYAQQRVGEVHDEHGTLDEHRLYHNMLSSMPLCFNLFVPLRNRPDVAAEVLRSAFGVEVDEVMLIECEWAPTPPVGLGDRTAFDAVIRYRHGDQRHLLGIETKYTETFSPTEYAKPGVDGEIDRRERYRAVCDASGWFDPDASAVLWRSGTNQLWRNTMLAATCEELDDVDHAAVVVVGLQGDRHAAKAVAGVRDQLIDERRLLDVSIDRLVAAGKAAGLVEWAKVFTRRYLDLDPVVGAPRR